jgi:phospholipase/lecithinase/hemolysin
MTFLRLTLAAAALSLSATLAPAATVGGYTSFFAFGDSLTDNGNLFAASGGTFPPSPPYFNGRFSNGPTWAETIAARFAAAGLVAANFAFGGANAVTNAPADTIPDLQLQLGIAAATVPPAAIGSRPLVSLWFGANDIFNELDALAPTEASAIAVAQAAATAVAGAAAFIAQNGLTNILLFNLPDLGKIPRFAVNDPTDAEKATKASQAFNARLGLTAALLRSQGVNVIEIDVKSLFDDLIADPTQFGLKDASDFCVKTSPVSICTPQKLAELAFFDQSHPTAKVHGVIANTVLAAIPLPASALMLGAGLAGLAALRRRRAA